MKAIDELVVAIDSWNADGGLHREATIPVGDALANAARSILLVLDEEHAVRMRLTEGVARLVATQSGHVRAHREIRARIALSDVPIHVAADIEQILCEIAGDFGEQSSAPLRDRIADILDEEHGPCVTEGGCDFRATWITDRPHGPQERRYSDVLDRIIEEVQRDAS